MNVPEAAAKANATRNAPLTATAVAGLLAVPANKMTTAPAGAARNIAADAVSPPVHYVAGRAAAVVSVDAAEAGTIVKLSVMGSAQTAVITRAAGRMRRQGLSAVMGSEKIMQRAPPPIAVAGVVNLPAILCGGGKDDRWKLGTAA